MARTDQQAFLDAYLGGGISANRNKVKSAGSTGTAAMNAGANTSLPSLYDLTDDAAQVGMAYVEAAQKQQEAAAKAAQQAAKEAENAREQMIKDNIQNMRDVAKMNRDKKKRVQKIADNMASSETATLASAKKKTGILPNVLPGLTEASPYVSPYDSLGSPNLIGDGKFVPVLQKVEGRTMEYTGVPARSLAKTAAVERPASAYDAMTTSEKLTAAQNLSAQAQALQKQIDALERQKIEPKTGAGAYDEEAYAIVQKNRQIVEQQEALEAQRKQVNDQISEVSDALWNDPEYAASIQTEIDAKPESQRIEQYLDPSYKLNKLEEKDAKEIADALIKEAYDVPRGATQEQLSEAFDKEILGQRLINKVSNAAAVSAGIASSIPLAKEVDRALTNWTLGEDADKYRNDLPSLENLTQGAQTQNPIAYTGGNIGGNLALYSAASAAARGIPALQSFGQTVASTPAAQAVQGLPVIGRLGTADAIAGMTGDALVDLSLDTLPRLGSNLIEYNQQQNLIQQGLAEGNTMDDMLPALQEYYGEYLTPGSIAADTLQNVGANFALGLGGEIVPELFRAGSNALRRGANAAQSGVDDATRAIADTPLPAVENATQAAQNSADDVINAWRNGTLTNAQMDTLKPNGVNADLSLNDLPESIGAMRHNPQSYAGMQAEYGTIAPGENAARVVDVPISTNGMDRVSASARTFMEAPQTTDELVGMFEKGVEDGLFSHDVKRDADSLARAVSAVEQDGYQKTLEYWKGLMRDGASLNKEQIVQGQLLYTLAAKNGDTETAMDLAGDLARIATEAGQNLQAQRLLKRMTPEGKLYYARQTVDSFNRQLKQQLGDGFQNIEIPNELTQALMDATSTKAQNDAMQNIYQYVADQLPADWGTRWNAWRYLSMLSNPATHIRNVLSNAVNIPARKFKNLIGAAIESGAVKAGKLDPSQRTKALLGNSESDKALKAFAKKDLDNVMGDPAGAKKYSDRGEILSRIDPFKINGQWGKTDASGAVARGARAVADKATGVLSWLYRANSNALSAEDMLFKRSAYVDSLAGYLKAQNIDPAKATQEQLNAAREYAVEEALRATYTEYNKLAETLSMIEKRHPVGKVFMGGAVPFKSTPLNIIRRGVNYSPAGLVMNTVTGFINLKNGKITASQFIDNISQGLSGTVIFLLGTWFGMNGYINSVGPENRKEQTLKSGQGVQSYSFNLPWGGTYTIDWAGPSAMALLAGAQLGKEFENEDLSFDDVVNAALNVIEPAFDTTMLSGINSAIQSATYAGNNEVVSAATQAFSNFFTQGVPSISGAIARAYDPIRRTAYSESDGAFGKIKENVQRMQNKIPVQSTQNQPYIDVWGREQENPGGNFVGRLAYNMLSPGYYSPDMRTVADDVVEGLYQQTGDAEILPGLFGSSVTVDGEEIRLSPENYTLAKQTKGQASSQMIESLYDYPQYSAIDTEAQADVVKDVYRLAHDVAKYQVVPSLYDELVSDIESGDASKSEMLAEMYLTGGAEQVIPYLVADELTSDVRADKNAKGNSIPGSREKNFIETLMQNGYTRGDAEALYQLLK